MYLPRTKGSYITLITIATISRRNMSADSLQYPFYDAHTCNVLQRTCLIVFTLGDFISSIGVFDPDRSRRRRLRCCYLAFARWSNICIDIPQSLTVAPLTQSQLPQLASIIQAPGCGAIVCRIHQSLGSARRCHCDETWMHIQVLGATNMIHGPVSRNIRNVRTLVRESSS